MITTYSITHALGRANICTPDADAIVQRVNALTASNGDSIDREFVQSELDALATADVQRQFGLSIVATENNDC